MDEVCFQHDMPYGKYKYLEKRTPAGKVLRDKALNTAKDPNHNGYGRALASMAFKFFDKISKGTGIKNEVKQNQQLAN